MSSLPFELSSSICDTLRTVGHQFFKKFDFPLIELLASLNYLQRLASMTENPVQLN